MGGDEEKQFSKKIDSYKDVHCNNSVNFVA